MRVSATQRRLPRSGALLLAVSLAFAAGCNGVRGPVHRVKILVDPTSHCPTGVELELAERGTRCPPDAPADAVCIAAGEGEGVEWYTSTDERFKIHLDPFRRGWSSGGWFRPKGRLGPKAPQAKDVSGRVTFKYTVTVDACAERQPLDPHIVVMY